MKKSFSGSLLLLLIYCATGVSQTGWIKQQSGTTEALRSVFFTDTLTGVVVGDNGTILQTFDGGNHWNAVNSHRGNFDDIFFVNKNTGFLVGSVGGGFNTGDYVLRTDNGGTTWQEQASGTYYWMYKAHFMDENTGIVVCTHNRILRTTNGGTTWDSVNTVLQGETIGLRSVSFADSQNGIIVGDSGTVLKTTNGGATWSVKYDPTIDATQLLDVSYKRFAEGSEICYAAGGGKIFRSIDGGVSWIQQFKDRFPIPSLSMVDENTVTAVGGSGFIVHTTNGGTTWQSQSSGTQQHLMSVFFATPSIGFAVGDSGTILRTSTGGVSSVDKDRDESISTFTLDQNYPNPVTQSSVVSCQLPEGSKGVFEVRDMLGRVVHHLYIDSKQSQITINASALPDGMYVYSVTDGLNTAVRRMVVMK